MESWVGENCQAIAVKPPSLVNHQEEEISEVHSSKLDPSRTLKQWGNSLPYPFFRHELRSRLELRECPQAGCLQGGDEEFEDKREVYSVNNLVREADKGILLFAVFFKHGGSEFSRVLMSTRLANL